MFFRSQLAAVWALLGAPYRRSRPMCGRSPDGRRATCRLRPYHQRCRACSRTGRSPWPSDYHLTLISTPRYMTRAINTNPESSKYDATGEIFVPDNAKLPMRHPVLYLVAWTRRASVTGVRALSEINTLTLQELDSGCAAALSGTDAPMRCKLSRRLQKDQGLSGKVDTSAWRSLHSPIKPWSMWRT